MGTAELKGQATKGCEQELRGADIGRRQGRGAGGQDKVEALGYLAKTWTFFP